MWQDLRGVKRLTLVKAGREDGVELERARKELRFYAKCNRRTERLYTGERCGLV